MPLLPHSSLSFVSVLFWLSRFLLVCISSPKPLCNNHDGMALLQFQQSFLVNKSASSDTLAYPKVASWNEDGKINDCCLWNGVECDEETGRVIGLDLSSSFLYGSLTSSGSLFYLVDLQKLNLGDNDFNFSQIPPTIKLLSKLTYLNLSHSAFSGQIPSEIKELSNLKTLDLSSANISSTIPHAISNLSSLTSLNLNVCSLWGHIPTSLGNLTKLEYLNLGYNYVSGQIPSSLGNLIHLSHLILRNNQLIGQLPLYVSNLTQLSSLDLRYNKLHGLIPYPFSNFRSLTYLSIGNNNLSGPIPKSLSKLVSLSVLGIEYNNFYGQFPSCVSNLTNLKVLSLSHNNFIPGSLSWVGKLSKLTFLKLSNINIVGQIPSLENLTHLNVLHLAGNELTGPIPLWICNLTEIIELGLGDNQLHGSIPESISKLVNLGYFHLALNFFSGTIKSDMFTSLKNLWALDISGNNLSLETKISGNATLPKLTALGLGNCNIGEFPDFLRHQDELVYLNLAENNIHGPIPEWVGNASRETLEFFSLKGNFITDVKEPSMFSSLNALHVLGLDDNKFHGPHPIPALSIIVYTVSDNSLIGEISPLLCNMTSLAFLDLSFNNLIGKIPPCLGNISNSLQLLNLTHNSLHGNIPDMFTNGGKLKMIDLSHNRFEGLLPRSLTNCGMLEILDVRENKICDKFPFWLGTLPNLQVLSLRSNHFFGSMGSVATVDGFSKLRILDLSSNNFTGILPPGFFQNLSGMKDFDVSHYIYMEISQIFLGPGEVSVSSHVAYQTTLISKGLYMRYWKISNAIAAIDLSSNKFHGFISQSIGNLKILNVLNLSSNNLSGQIPSVLGSLTKLESLDLSVNMLSREILSQLLQLTFLEYLNVLNNQLVGPIPHGNQFNTFDNSSFLGNSRLCGNPLSKKCEDLMDSPSSHASLEENEDSSLLAYIGWKIVVLGYGYGLIVGVTAGYIFSTKNKEWLLQTFKIKQQSSQKRRTQQRGRHAKF